MQPSTTDRSWSATRCMRRTTAATPIPIQDGYRIGTAENPPKVMFASRGEIHPDHRVRQPAAQIHGRRAATPGANRRTPPRRRAAQNAPMRPGWLGQKAATAPREWNRADRTEPSAGWKCIGRLQAIRWEVCRLLVRRIRGNESPASAASASQATGLRPSR